MSNQRGFDADVILSGGGLVGQTSLSGGIVNSSAGSTGSTVTGGTYAGGVVGYYNSGTALVTNAGQNIAVAFRGATVSAGGTYAGGIVGYSAGSAALTGLSASANVTASGTAGGLAGRPGHGREFARRGAQCAAPVSGRSARGPKLMDILYLLIPLSVVLVFFILAGLWWAVYRGQFEDIESEGRRILDESRDD